MSAFVKVMVNLRAHPKIVSVSSDAFRLYVCSLCWAAEHMTDGAIPDAMLAGLAPGMKARPAKAAAELVAFSLWNRVENGWVIHGYLDHQTSAATIKKSREEAAKRAAESRARQTENHGGNGVPF